MAEEATLKELLGLKDSDADALSENGITTLEKLEEYDNQSLIDLPSIGKVTAGRIMSALEVYRKANPLEPKAAELEAAEAEPEATEAAEAATDQIIENVVEETIDGGKDEVIASLTRYLAWAIAVFSRQPGSQGPYLAALLRQNVLALRPDLSANELADIRAELDEH